MEFADQHVEAIGPTVRVKNEVSAGIFDDKVCRMGTVTVNNGEIRVSLDYLPGMVSNEATRDFLSDSISLGIKACWDARGEAFLKDDSETPSGKATREFVSRVERILGGYGG